MIKKMKKAVPALKKKIKSQKHQSQTPQTTKKLKNQEKMTTVMSQRVKERES